MGKPDLTPTEFSAESALPPRGGQSTDGVLFRLAVALAFAVLSICYIKGVSGTVAVLTFAGIIASVPTAALIVLAVAAKKQEAKTLEDIKRLLLLPNVDIDLVLKRIFETNPSQSLRWKSDGMPRP